MKFIVLVALGSLVACVKTGAVTERQPMSSLASYKSASVRVVSMPQTLTDAEDRKKELKEAIGERLQKGHVFGSVLPDGGDVVLEVMVSKVDKGDGAMRALAGNAGAAEVAATVSLKDKAGKVVGAFDVMGNSKKNASTTVGGINTQSMEDATGKAFDAAADEIAAYLAKKH